MFKLEGKSTNNNHKYETNNQAGKERTRTLGPLVIKFPTLDRH